MHPKQKTEKRTLDKRMGKYFNGMLTLPCRFKSGIFRRVKIKKGNTKFISIKILS